MNSIKRFVPEELIPRIEDDAKQLRILNEADLQYRVAHHLDQRYISSFSNVFLANQPYIRIGKGRSSADAKPDIVLSYTDDGPFCAFELKCYLENGDKKFSTIRDSVWADIGQLKKFKQTYGDDCEATFAIVLIDIEDKDTYKELMKEFQRDREQWMAHCLRVFVINCCWDSNFRKRPRYEQWSDRWLERRRLVSLDN